MDLVKINLVLLVICNSYVFARNPLMGLTGKQLITKQGYPLETHKVITEDGYVLQTLRIPTGKKDAVKGKRPAVLCFTGFASGASDFVSLEHNSLGFILAEAGYDVWLGNTRGTTLAKKHLTYKPMKHAKQFYNYTIHEIGYYDVAANIDYIKNVTKQEKIFYIGYAQGNSIFFALAASRPEYNKSIRLMVALNPYIYLNNTTHLLTEFVYSHIDELSEVVEFYGLYELIPQTYLVTAIAEILCNSFLQEICTGVAYFLGGISDNYLNKTSIPVIFTNAPAGIGYLHVKHVVQLYYSENFQRLDHGKETNLLIYGTEKPPVYDIKKITAPVAAYYGTRDALVSYIDAERTIAELPNVVYTKKLVGYAHFDTLWAVDVADKIFNDIVKLFNSY